MHGIPWGVPQAHEAMEGDLDGLSPGRCREGRRIVLWRYWQARLVGIDPLNARMFAESDCDLGVLRSLVCEHGCPPVLALRIVL
jgi:hypothetical protein